MIDNKQLYVFFQEAMSRNPKGLITPRQEEINVKESLASATAWFTKNQGDKKAVCIAIEIQMKGDIKPRRWEEDIR